jgi:glycosyltransferase involved in cell wall biosynthesis
MLYTYNQGYLSKFFFELSVQLVNRGHSVVNFAFKQTKSNFTLDGVEVIIEKKSNYYLNYYKICGLIYKQKPDIIISNFSYANPSLFFGKILGIKKNIVWFHTLKAQMHTKRSNIFIKSLFLRLADIVIANSYITKDELVSEYSVSANNVRPIPFFSTINETIIHFSKDSDKIDKQLLKIGCPGRMATHKNQSVVLNALSKIKKTTMLNFQLSFAGSGEEESNLKEQSLNLNLSNNIVFLGHLNAEKMIDFYKNLDLVILPSMNEAFGLVFIEAISLGIPVLVSSQFGALTFINESQELLNKFTFDPKSPEDLANKVLLHTKGLGLTSDQFKNLYETYFSKESVFENFYKDVMTD